MLRQHVSHPSIPFFKSRYLLLNTIQVSFFSQPCMPRMFSVSFPAACVKEETRESRFYSCQCQCAAERFCEQQALIAVINRRATSHWFKSAIWPPVLVHTYVVARRRVRTRRDARMPFVLTTTSFEERKNQNIRMRVRTTEWLSKKTDGTDA